MSRAHLCLGIQKADAIWPRIYIVLNAPQHRVVITWEVTHNCYHPAKTSAAIETQNTYLHEPIILHDP